MKASVGEIIAKYRRKAKYTQPVLAQKLAEDGIQISYKTISGWEKGLSEPSVTTFLHLCRILSIPDCVEEFFGSNPSDPIAVLNEEGKKKVLDYIDSLVHPVSYLKESNIIPYVTAAKEPRTMRLYACKISAGTGDFLDSDDFAEIQVGENVPKEADFAVTISGDSMEPMFSNHQTVYVHQQETLGNGEVGIFYLNDDAYIKMLQDNQDGVFLISLNRKYKPIPVKPHDSFRVFGKVCM